MKITGIKTERIENGQKLLPILLLALPRPLRERDIVCVTSKVVALEQGRALKLSDLKISEAAKQLPQLLYGKDFKTYPGLAQLLLDEAEKIYRAKYVFFTLRDAIFMANAGIDLSNTPEGYAVPWPTQPWSWAHGFRRQLRAHFGLRELGVALTDSRIMPLRRGVSGIAIAWSGIEGVESQVGKPDLYGKPLKLTEKAVADDLASVAVLVSGESAEATPFVLCEESPAVFTDRESDGKEYFIAPREDLYAGIYAEALAQAMS